MQEIDKQLQGLGPLSTQAAKHSISLNTVKSKIQQAQTYFNDCKIEHRGLQGENISKFDLLAQTNIFISNEQMITNSEEL